MFLIVFSSLKAKGGLVEMAISESTEAIRRKIISDAERNSHDVIQQAKGRASEILNNARKRAEEMKEAELEQIKKHVKDRSLQDLAEKKVAHHRRLQTFKSQLIDDAFDKVREELGRYTKEPAYSETLRHLIIESGVALGGGRISVRVNEADAKRLSRNSLRDLSKVITKRTRTETQVIMEKDSITTIGGAVVSAIDQKASIDNTFEARLKKAKEDAKAELEAILFK
jgi:vacuolar-type H+-ATPase subunit E/Vma4